jgi:hypothetical protein
MPAPKQIGPILFFILAVIVPLVASTCSRRLIFGSSAPYRPQLLSHNQIHCAPMKSSGDLVHLFDLAFVGESHPLNDLGHAYEAEQLSPASIRTFA